MTEKHLIVFNGWIQQVTLTGTRHLSSVPDSRGERMVSRSSSDDQRLINEQSDESCKFSCKLFLHSRPICPMGGRLGAKWLILKIKRDEEILLSVTSDFSECLCDELIYLLLWSVDTKAWPLEGWASSNILSGSLFILPVMVGGLDKAYWLVSLQFLTAIAVMMTGIWCDEPVYVWRYIYIFKCLCWLFIR